LGYRFLAEGTQSTMRKEIHQRILLGDQSI